jgi:adenylate kinase family enzyme
VPARAEPADRPHDADPALAADRPAPALHAGTRPLRRIVVKGTSGAGKTTVAAELTRRLGLLHVELDALHHGPDWSAPTAEAFRAQVRHVMATAPDGWVIDGNYDSKLGDTVVQAADAIVWLDLPLPLKLLRLWRRTHHRIGHQIELWNGNRESWRGAFVDPDSLFRWTLGAHRRHRRQWPSQFAGDPRFVRLRSDAAVRTWLASATGEGDDERELPTAPIGDPEANRTAWSELRPGAAVTVVKLTPASDEAARYPGLVIDAGAPAPWLAVRATWVSRLVDLDGLTFVPGDTLHEFFSPAHLFNVFALFAPDGDLRGWYANVTHPARLDPGTDPPTLTWHDLYVDLIAFPDGRAIVRDEDELAEAGLAAADPALHATILATRDDLLRLCAARAFPFHEGDR